MKRRPRREWPRPPVGPGPSANDTLLFADHVGIGAPAPMLAAVAAAAATQRLRVGTQVLNHDLRHTGVLIEEAATAMEVTGRRFELGLGAGHVRVEYEAIGLDFDPASARIDRLADTAALVRERLPDLPIMIGGNGDRQRAADALVKQWAAEGEEVPANLDVLDSPFLLLGTTDEIAGQIRYARDQVGHLLLHRPRRA